MSENQNEFIEIEEDEKHVRVLLEDLLTNYQKQKITVPEKGDMTLTGCNTMLGHF
jgi:hypothetical protein